MLAVLWAAGFCASAVGAMIKQIRTGKSTRIDIFILILLLSGVRGWFPSSREALLDCRAQAIGRTVSEQQPIDIEGRSHLDAVYLAVGGVAANDRHVLFRCEFGVETLSIQAQQGRIFLQRFVVERGLVLEQKIDILPEFA